MYRKLTCAAKQTSLGAAPSRGSSDIGWLSLSLRGGAARNLSDAPRKSEFVQLDREFSEDLHRHYADIVAQRRGAAKVSHLGQQLFHESFRSQVSMSDERPG